MINLEEFNLDSKFGIDQEKYGKLIYEFCNSVNWDDMKIEELAKKVKCSVKEVRQVAINYFDNVTLRHRDINFSYYEPFYNCCKKVDWDYDRIETTEFYKKNSYRKWFIMKNAEYYANLENLLISESYVKRTFQEMQLQEDYLDKLNPVLLRHGIKTYSIGRTDEEREITLKYMYDNFKENNGIIGQLASEFGLPLHTILNYINEYIENVLKNNADRNKKGYRVGAFKYVFERLKEATRIEEIVDIIESSGINIEYLKASLFPYILNYDDESNRQMLKEKLERYSEYVKKEKEEQKERLNTPNETTISDANKYISMFIDSKDSNMDEFYDKTGLTEKTFKMYVEIVKEYNQSLYEKYLEKFERKRKQRFAIIATKIRKIVFLMKNGIDENGITRDFDLIDYFQNTSLSFSDFSKLSKEILSNQDLAIVRKFINKNKAYEKDNLTVIQSILNEKVEINCQHNNNGIPIAGTGEIFDNERKMKIINYLKETNVPINIKTYTLAFRRYIKGTLEIDEDMKTRRNK